MSNENKIRRLVSDVKKHEEIINSLMGSIPNSMLLKEIDDRFDVLSSVKNIIKDSLEMIKILEEQGHITNMFYKESENLSWEDIIEMRKEDYDYILSEIAKKGM